jgi:hypothetical protein
VTKKQDITRRYREEVVAFCALLLFVNYRTKPASNCLCHNRTLPPPIPMAHAVPICGRFVVNTKVNLLGLLADLRLEDDYNVAPTLDITVVRERHEDRERRG